MRVAVETLHGALLVPQQAVSELQGSYQVAAVDGNDAVSIKPIHVGDQIGVSWVVRDGLNPGERVIVDGIQKVGAWHACKTEAGARRPAGQLEETTVSNFFIKRPIVAMVIAIVTVIVGAVSIARLPVSQFPNIVPPEIQLLATYVGADAQTLEQSVATPIEQQINGVDKMNYMYSLNATGNSQTTVVVNFDVTTDPNNDLILTQSRANPGCFAASRPM